MALLDDALLRNAAERFGTPLHLIDEATLLERVAFLRAHLPARIRIVYAMKANPLVLPLLESCIDGFEVCSPGEYRICRNLGIAPEKLLISGVNKDSGFIDELFESGSFGCITAESPRQFELIEAAARRHERPANVLLRLTSASQFGMDASEIRRIIAQHDPASPLHIRGIHYFSGTQKSSPKRIARELGKLDEFLLSLENELGFACEELEYGPGLPVAYFEADEYDEAAFLDEIANVVRGMRFAGTLSFEHGRFIAATCGRYLTSVVDTKTNKGQRYAIVDGGMHQLVYYGHSMAMNTPACHVLGQTDAPCPSSPAETVTFPAVDGAVADRLQADAARTADDDCVWSICGSLCTANDILLKQFHSCSLEEGSIFAFENTGAYCMMEGPALLLSRDLPAVVLNRTEGGLRLLRDAGETHPINTPLAI